MTNTYSLSFISDADLFNHVRETVEKYSFSIDLNGFNKNIVDPIKLTFDAKVYDKTVRDVIETVFAELEQLLSNLLNSLCLLAFKKYQGFEDFEC